MDQNIIAFAKGVSANENIHRMIDTIKPGFEKHGFQCVDFDTTDKSSYENLMCLVSEGRLRLLFSMNMAMNTIHLNREWLKDTSLFLYLLDHPYLVFPACEDLVSSFKDIHLSYTGQSQVKFASAIHPGARNIVCLPHGAEAHDAIPWEERDIPVLFVGNAGMDGDPEAYRASWKRYGDEKWENLNAIAEICLRNPGAPLEEAAMSVLSVKGSPIPEACAYMRAVDMYLRSKMRWQALDRLSILENIHIYGKGWERFSEKEDCRMVCHGPVSNNEALDLMRRSRIVLNLVPAYYESHERVFGAMSLGCLVFTPETSFLAGEFTKDAMCFFQAPESLADGVSDWISRPADGERIAMRANEIFLAGHTWEHRAAQVLSAIGAID